MNQSLFEALKNSSAFGAYIYTEGGRFVFANKAFCNIVGYSCSELINSINLPQLFEGKQKEEALKNMKRRMKGEVFPYEYKELYYKTKDGILKTVLDSSYTIIYDGKPSGLSIIFDITEKKIYQTLYKSLSEINQLIIKSEDEDKLLKDICDTMHEKTGFSLAVVGSVDESTKLFKTHHLSGDDKYMEYFQDVEVSVDDSIPTGRGTVGRAYRTKKITVSANIQKDHNMDAWRDRHTKYGIHSLCSIPIFKHGQIAYILILYSNIAGMFSTEHLLLIKEMQMNISFALKKMEKDRELRMFENAFSKSMNWVVATDKDGNILKANKAVSDISGYKLQELIGKNPSIFKSGYHDDEFYKNLWDTIKNGNPFRTTFTNKRKDGTIFWLDSIITPVVENGEIKRYVDISRDITKEVEQSQQVQRVSNLYKTLYDINQLIIKRENEDNVIKKLPEIIVKNLGFKIADVGTIDENKKLKFLSYSVKENKYLRFLQYAEELFSNDNSSVEDTHDDKLSESNYLIKRVKKLFNNKNIYSSHYPFVRAIKNKRVCLSNNTLSTESLKPFHNIMRELPINSCFSLPIVKNHETIAVLFGYSDIKNFFDKDICRLLEQIKSDLSIYLDRIETEKWHDILSQAVNTGYDFVVVMDESFKIVYVNEHMLRLTGYSRDELIGKHHSIFSSKTHTKDFSAYFYKTLSSGTPFSGGMLYKTKGSKFIRAFVNIFPYKTKNSELYYIATGRDITDKIELQKVLEDSVNKDSLTGLASRAFFIESIKLFVSRAEYEKLLGAVAIINPIRFSNINHAYGFDVGNSVLIEISNRLKNFLRKYDTVAKLESEKFGIVLKDIKNEEDIFVVLIKLLNKLSESYIMEDKTINISFNAGVSIYPKDAEEPEILIDKAEIALLDVKHKEESLGFYKEELKKIVQKKIKLKNEMSKALKNREFILYYQPYFNAKTQKIEGVEALIRWKKDGKIVPPMEFIPYLEETGMISTVEDWIVEEVSNKQKQWKKKQIKPIPISINISPTSFARKDFADNLISNIIALNADPSLINLEIIERLFIDNLDYANSTLNRLKQHGFNFSLDDFGTGYSSLSYLSSFPIDYLKIDISFIRKMLSDSSTKAIVKTIISLSKDLHLKTIAEGVEIKEQLDVLKSMGCDYIQGYYFSKPLPEEEFEDALCNCQ